MCNILSICIALNKAIDSSIRDKEFKQNLIKYMPIGFGHLSVIRDENNNICDYLIIEANSFSSKIYNVDIEKMVGHKGSELHQPDIFKKKLSFIQNHINNESYNEIDEETYPGHYAHKIFYSPKEDELVELCIDTTLNVKAAKALGRSEKLFKDTFTNIPVAVGLYSPEGKVINLNTKFLEVFGLTSIEDVKDYVFFEDFHATKKIKDSIFNNDQSEFRLKYSFDAKRNFNSRRSGVINLYCKITKLYDKDHNCFGFLLICMEDSDYFIAMNRIRDFENLFSIISDYSKVGYAKVNIMNSQGFAVKQWYRNMGEEENIPISEILGVYRGIHPDDRKKIINFLERAKKGEEKNFRCEVRSRKIGSHDKWNWIYKNLVVTKYTPEENEIELIGVNYDITELKDIEEELSKARDKAETMDKLKSAFLANMSHEIRTPLNAIVGFSDIMSETDSIDERKEYARIIRENNEVLLQLINDILDLSKIEAGTFEIVCSEVSAKELCLDLLRSSEFKRKDNVKLEFDTTLPDYYFYSDHNRLYQVLANFVTNSLKFTEEGSINISYEYKDKSIIFSVTDTGMGIEKDKLPHIFERFYKLNAFIQGTGLGLSICQSIIDQLDGKIGVESELGKGSRFWFSIPFLNDTQEEIQEKMEGKLVARSDQRPLVLISEDVETNYSLVYSILHEDYRILWAHDGQEAIDLCREKKPDIILMDIKMPILNGFESTRIIRKFNKTIPIIAITAYTFDDDKMEAIEAGCTDFITKPITTIALKDKIRETLLNIIDSKS